MSNVAVVTIGGSTVTSQIRNGSVRIDDLINESPNTASFIMDGSAPSVTAEVKIGLGDVTTANLIFAGHIIAVRQFYEGRKANAAYEVTCQDYTFLLNQYRPRQAWTSTSASTIAAALITNFSATFTSTNVQASLASVSIAFDGTEDMATCLTRLAALVGAYWYVDYAKDLHFFTSEASAAPDTVGDQSGTKLLHDPPITREEDRSQLRTRVYVRGAGARALAAITSGATVIPVEDSTIFSASGGSVMVGSQVLTYTGKTSNTKTGSRVNSYPGPAPVVTITATGGTNVTVGNTYSFCIVWTISGSPSPPTVGSVAVTGTSDGAGKAYAIRVTKPTTPSGATAWLVYASINGGAWKAWSGGSFPVATTFTDFGSADSFWSGGAPSVTVTNTQIVTSDPIAVGSTAIGVQDVTQFSSSGGVAVAAGQAITYTGFSITSGFGALVGIPSSGFGSITAEIPSGSLIINAPALLGVPSSGIGSVIYSIAAGDAVRLWVTRNDTTAQSSYGIYEHLVDDDTLLTDAECQTRGDADLTLFKNPIVTLTYATRDVKSRSGKTATVSFSGAPSYSGTYKIVRVTIDQIDICGGRLAPRFTCTVSTVKFSLADLLRRTALAVA